MVDDGVEGGKREMEGVLWFVRDFTDGITANDLPAVVA